jgi:hypothetical protein
MGGSCIDERRPDLALFEECRGKSGGDMSTLSAGMVVSAGEGSRLLHGWEARRARRGWRSVTVSLAAG